MPSLLGFIRRATAASSSSAPSAASRKCAAPNISRKATASTTLDAGPSGLSVRGFLGRNSMRLTLTVLLALSTSAAFAQAPQAPLNSPPAATLKGGKKLAPKWDAKAREIYKTAVETPTVAGRKDENLKLANYLAAELKAAGWAESDIHVLPYTSKPGVETAAIVARWPAAGTPKKKPMLIMG